MATLNIEIDGKPLQVESGDTIMDAANQAGIPIPHFCYHKKLSIAANCRMCLVQVEKAPKPLPACATPVTDGMKVYTRSDYAIQAQKSVMEFLLINHPLDCPICDQGGECTLQDLAVGYGGSSSRYQEIKRVVREKNLGPLIATDMTRCIHCSRCVRFGQEIAGVMELGMAGRGEHTEVMPFLETQVASELSGNVIDLCPVGALTSKPFRYSARTWELSRRPSISPHDSLGSNIEVHVKDNKVMRVLPRENEDVNECWLSDRDRFSYEGLNTAERLTWPMIKQNGQWIETDWQSALQFVADRLKTFAPEDIGALSTPYRTAEELFLLQKLMRGMGSGNVDHRLRHSDFSLDALATGSFWLGMPVTYMSRLNRMLVVGSNLRKDHPLMAHRIRESVRWYGELNLINAHEDEFLGKVNAKRIVPPSQLAAALAGVCIALAELKKQPVPPVAAAYRAHGGLVDDIARRMAASLAGGETRAVFLGNMAQHHPTSAQIHALAQEVAQLAGASFGVLGEAANSVGAMAVGAVPHHGPLRSAAIQGRNAAEMLAGSLKAYLLLAVEAELDTHDPVTALKSIEGAEFVVVMSPYKGKSLDYADVLLPIAPWTETSGTFINTEGRVQGFSAVVRPLGETRPAWKVLRVLGNLLGLAGFDHNDSKDVLRDALGDTPTGNVQAYLCNEISGVAAAPAAPGPGLERVAEVPIYQTDAVVRRSPSLQRTLDAALPVARMHSQLIARLGLTENGRVSVRQTGSALTLKVERDDHLPDNCIRVPCGHPLTAHLGPMFGPITAEPV
ncbi:MAG: NADH-quinone oxidoreductase subunit G [Hydrogenophilales bacterium 16-64-46]|nr:MAG: NADH-quinone oxidoreductase subunit G [Hydrogenophilales bacterium 12-64-13]OYZ04928.1 MAG: NADH-quinone oxidoreductase subunit G [Hydrogenophilales bacterium 16-64-46]OZA37571.1 MAG: NADH-quinone oxidoreductase subunit G [Hydrogenophilales bacterium 17-64-34]HQT00840.1 NADH-quinone oxidoreductase subunit NuoG [Thiobacillus sp.]